MKQIVILIGVLTLFVFGCQQPAQQETSPEANYEEALAAIEKANTQINELVKAGKYEEAGQYFSPDVIQLVAGQPPIMSRAEWIAAQKQNAQIGEWDLQLEVLELEVSGDVAVERGRGVNTFTANENSPMPSMSMTGDYMVLWKKVDGQWQIQWDYVVVQPPTEEAGS